MLLLIIVSVLLGAIGQILVKIGAQHLELSFTWTNLWPSLIAIMKNIPVMSGLLIYGLSFIIWVKVLTKTDLSYAYPFVSIGYLFILIVSYFFFKEHFTLSRVMGTMLIVLGVIFVSRS